MMGMARSELRVCIGTSGKRSDQPRSAVSLFDLDMHQYFHTAMASDYLLLSLSEVFVVELIHMDDVQR
jgi:hypothetical protein